MRSRGPGGQNVNKTNSACLLRWNLRDTVGFSLEMKDRLLRRLGSQMTDDGDILLRSDQYRDQESNRKACIEKLISLIDMGLKEAKVRKKTKPKRSSIRKRLNEKKINGEVKALRQKIRG